MSTRAAPLYCETCRREVGAAHRTPEALWLHRVTLAPTPSLEEERRYQPDNHIAQSQAGPTVAAVLPG
jgi:hypothetical protein